MELLNFSIFLSLGFALSLSILLLQSLLYSGRNENNLIEFQEEEQDQECSKELEEEADFQEEGDTTIEHDHLDDDDTAVDLPAENMICNVEKLALPSRSASSLELSLSESATLLTEPAPSSPDCEVNNITEENVLDQLPASIAKPLIMIESLFEKSTDLAATGVKFGLKPFEKAFGLHLQPALQSSSAFVLKQKETLVEIIKKRAFNPSS